MCPGSTSGNASVVGCQKQRETSSVVDFLNENVRLQSTVANLKEKVETLEREKLNSLSRLHKSQNKLRNLGKRLRRRISSEEERTESQEQLEESLAEVQILAEEMSQQNVALEERNASLCERKCQLHRLMLYYRGRCRRLSEIAQDTHSSCCDELLQEEQLAALRQTVRDLHQQLDDVIEELAQCEKGNFNENSEVVTFKNGKYTDAVRHCCLSLLSHNVGVERVSPIIRNFLSTLTNLTIGRLPSVDLLS